MPRSPRRPGDEGAAVPRRRSRPASRRWARRSRATTRAASRTWWACSRAPATFITDLSQAIDLPLTLDYIAVSSYGAATKSSGEVKLVKDLDQGLEGRDLLVVEDIVDTGLTLNYLLNVLRARGPRSLKVAALLSKPSRRLVEVEGRLRGLHHRGPLRGRLRPRLQREVPEPARHRDLRGIAGTPRRFRLEGGMLRWTPQPPESARRHVASRHPQRLALCSSDAPSATCAYLE